MKKSYSLSTLLLFVLIAALCAGLFRMSMLLADAEAEIESIRRDYGYIRVEDTEKLYVARIQQYEGRYRFVVPPGQRYFLHLTETDATTDEIPLSTKPKITVNLNGWVDGADEILSYRFGFDPGQQMRYLRVSDHTASFFRYTPDDWNPDISMGAERYELEAAPQREFTTDENILLVHARTPSLNRGLMLWLEPESRRQARRSNLESNEPQDDEPQPEND